MKYDMIPFNKSICLTESEDCVADALRSGHICGDRKYTKLCSEWMEQKFQAQKVLLTTSCTAALEMSAMLLNIQPGDEVIMPSYTFVTTANAFVMRGAQIVFVDIRPDTMNIDEKKIEPAITPRTKAIVVVHYAGVSCEMDEIMSIAERHHLPVVEDAAQAVMSTYKGKALGTIGTFGCYSFHETKNYTMGEGGAIVINDESYIERAEIIREKGTDRSRFFRGQVDKYSWVDIGSSFLPSDINAAILYPQFLRAEEINQNRLKAWNFYYDQLQDSRLELPVIPATCKHNAHMFYIKMRDLKERQTVLAFLQEHGVSAVFHYVPLHSSKAGMKYGRFSGDDEYTTKESERLIRLPIWYGIENKKIETIATLLKQISLPI